MTGVILVIPAILCGMSIVASGCSSRSGQSSSVTAAEIVESFHDQGIELEAVIGEDGLVVVFAAIDRNPDIEPSISVELHRDDDTASRRALLIESAKPPPGHTVEVDQAGRVLLVLADASDDLRTKAMRALSRLRE